MKQEEEVRKDSSNRLYSSSVVLVSGGAKGITSLCAIKLAEYAHCKFILVGRSAILESEPDWAKGIHIENDLTQAALQNMQVKGKKNSPQEVRRLVKSVISSREILTTIQTIQQYGGESIYLSVDITDGDALMNALKEAITKFGPVTGVIHGAGNLADKLIENKSGKDFDLVVNPKVRGLDSILKCINPDQLKFLVLFSSVAGFYGNIGQSDYAIANEILNKSAHILQRRMPNCRVISINWGPWETGMVSPELKEVFRQKNIRLISSEVGAQALLQEITSPESNETQIVVGSPLPYQTEFRSSDSQEFHIQRHLDLNNNLFLNDHCIGPQPVLPATCASAWIADTCEQLCPGYTFFQLEDFKVLKGITFNAEGSTNYDVDVQVLPANQDLEKKFEVTVTSQNAQNKKIFHYSARVILLKEIPTPPRHPSVESLHLDPSGFKNGTAFYENGTLFHGPAFQGIQQVISVDQNRLVTQVMLPEMDARLQGQFQPRSINPFINDAVVQSLLIWTQLNYDAPCLPSRLDGLIQYRPIPFGVPVWTILDVRFHNHNAISGDIIVQAEDGQEYFHFSGLEGTISKHLKRFFGKKESAALQEAQ